MPLPERHRITESTIVQKKRLSTFAEISIGETTCGNLSGISIGISAYHETVVKQ